MRLQREGEGSTALAPILGPDRPAVHRDDGSTQHVPLLLRIDTPIEVDYYVNGGILPFVLRDLMQAAA